MLIASIPCQAVTIIVLYTANWGPTTTSYVARQATVVGITAPACWAMEVRLQSHSAGFPGTWAEQSPTISHTNRSICTNKKSRRKAKLCKTYMVLEQPVTSQRRPRTDKVHFWPLSVGSFRVGAKTTSAHVSTLSQTCGTSWPPSRNWRSTAWQNKAAGLIYCLASCKSNCKAHLVVSSSKQDSSSWKRRDSSREAAAILRAARITWIPATQPQCRRATVTMRHYTVYNVSKQCVLSWRLYNKLISCLFRTWFRSNGKKSPLKAEQHKITSHSRLPSPSDIAWSTPLCNLSSASCESCPRRPRHSSAAANSRVPGLMIGTGGGGCPSGASERRAPGKTWPSKKIEKQILTYYSES